MALLFCLWFISFQLSVIHDRVREVEKTLLDMRGRMGHV